MDTAFIVFCGVCLVLGCVQLAVQVVREAGRGEETPVDPAANGRPVSSAIVHVSPVEPPR